MTRQFKRLTSIFLIAVMLTCSIGGLDLEAVSAATVKAPAKTKLTKLTSTVVTNTIDTYKVKITLKYKKVSKAKGYAIYRNSKLIKRTKKTTYSDVVTTPEAVLKYSVKAYKTYKEKQYFNSKTKKWQKKKPSLSQWKGKKTRSTTKYKYSKSSNVKRVITPAQAVLVNTAENVYAYEAETDSGRETIRKIIEGIDSSEVTTQDDDQIIHITVSYDNPLLEDIRNGNINEGDVVYIPDSEDNVLPVSLVYNGMDGNTLSFTPATIDQVIDDDIETTSNEIDSADPIAFTWTPGGNDEETFGLRRSLAADFDFDGISLDEEFSTQSVEKPGFQPQNINGMKIKSSFSGGKAELSLSSPNILLYDKDGDSETKYDQLVFSGSYSMKDIDPEFAFEWHPTQGALPQQMRFVLNYTQECSTKTTWKAEADLTDSIKKFNEDALDLHSFDKQKLPLGWTLSGLDIKSDGIIIGAVGLNLVTKKVYIGAGSVDKAADMNTIAVVIFSLDIDGSISAKVVGSYTASCDYKEGFNLQKDGYVGKYGSVSDNYSSDNHKDLDLGYKLDTYNEKSNHYFAAGVSAEGEANIGVAGNVKAGIVTFGIMPADIDIDLIGAEMNAKASGEGRFTSDNGWEGDATFDAGIKLYSSITANAKLKLSKKEDDATTTHGINESIGPLTIIWKEINFNSPEPVTAEQWNEKMIGVWVPMYGLNTYYTFKYRGKSSPYDSSGTFCIMAKEYEGGASSDANYKIDGNYLVYTPYYSSYAAGGDLGLLTIDLRSLEDDYCQINGTAYKKVSDDPSDNSEASSIMEQRFTQSLYGTWESSDSSIYLKLNSDGTMHYRDSDIEVDGTWINYSNNVNLTYTDPTTERNTTITFYYALWKKQLTRTVNKQSVYLDKKY